MIFLHINQFLFKFFQYFFIFFYFRDDFNKILDFLTFVKMFTPQEKAECASWFIKTKSDIQTPRNYTTKYAKQAPARQSIRYWHKQFVETGTVLHKPRSGRPSTSKEDIERIGHSFSRNPRKSILDLCSTVSVSVNCLCQLRID